jgi:Lar family restriction alleviation protein
MELKPCPFCGEEISLEILGEMSNKVECGTCESSTGIFLQESEAIEAWNRRV